MNRCSSAIALTALTLASLSATGCDEATASAQADANSNARPAPAPRATQVAQDTAQPKKDSFKLPAPAEPKVQTQPDEAAKGDLPPADGPWIEFDKTYHDFGLIGDRESVEHEFTFVNSGSDQLKIVSVRTTCGCTAVKPSKEVYLPGEKGYITVKFDPRRRQGKQSKGVTVETNVPGQARLKRLNINANIVADITIDPKVINFGRVEAGQGGEAEMIVRTRGSVNVTALVSNDANISGEVINSIERKLDDDLSITEHTLKITLAKDAPNGWVEGNVRIETDNPEGQKFTSFRAWSTVMGAVTVQPAKLSMGIIQPERAFQKQIRVLSRDGKPFTIKEIRFDAPDGMALQWKAVTEGASDAVIVRISGVGPNSHGKKEGELIVITDIPNEPPVIVPWQGNVRKASGRR